MACGFVKTNRGTVSAVIAIIVIISILSLPCPYAHAQTNIAFNPADQFSIPAYAGSISFAVNGTYSTAMFENNTWTFTNLRLTGSHPLENLEVSTQDSNVTIFSYIASNNTAVHSVRLRYVVEGQGKQILNLGLGGSNPNVEWSVTVDNNVSLAEGKAWSISNDGTMIVNGASGNVSIVRFDLSDLFGNVESNSNLPFYQQHSVAIAIATAFAVVVVIAVLIEVKKRGTLGESG